MEVTNQTGLILRRLASPVKLLINLNCINVGRGMIVHSYSKDILYISSYRMWGKNVLC